VVDVPTVSKFRQDLPEFRDSSKYPDSAIQFNLNLGAAVLRPEVWGTLLPFGIELYTAHNLVLDAIAAKAGATGIPGVGSGGLVSSKSVGAASISYDTSAGTEAGAGAYNLTTYGRRLWRYILMAGAAPTQINGCDPVGTVYPGLY
jgi:hypothetical protein